MNYILINYIKNDFTDNNTNPKMELIIKILSLNKFNVVSCVLYI